MCQSGDAVGPGLTGRHRWRQGWFGLVLEVEFSMGLPASRATVIDLLDSRLQRLRS